MATESVLRSEGSEPENGPRDFVQDQIDALKTRIEEYKVHGRDSEYMQERLTKLQNSKKGRRKGSDADDRADVSDCVVDEQEKARVKRESSKSAAGKKRHGVPDQKSEGSSNPISDAGQPEDVPDQVSPWPAKKPEPAISQPPPPAPGEGKDNVDVVAKDVKDAPKSSADAAAPASTPASIPTGSGASKPGAK